MPIIRTTNCGVEHQPQRTFPTSLRTKLYTEAFPLTSKISTYDCFTVHPSM